MWVCVRVCVFVCVCVYVGVCVCLSVCVCLCVLAVTRQIKIFDAFEYLNFYYTGSSPGFEYIFNYS